MSTSTGATVEAGSVRPDQQGVAAAGRGGAPSARSLALVHLSLLFVALSWGSNFVSIKYLLRSMGSADVLLLRLIAASLCFTGFLLVSRRGFPRVAPADRRRVLLMAVLGVTINTTSVAFGARLIPAAVGTLIASGNPIFTVVVSRVFAGEPLTRRKLSGIALAVVGFAIVLLYGGPQAHFSARNALGILITLGGPIAWAFYTVLSKPLLTRYDPTRFAGLITLLGTIPLLPLLLFNHRLPAEVAAFGPSQWLATTTMVLFALVLGYTLWYRGLRVLTPTQIAVYVYLVPVFGALGAWLVLGERITVYLLAGGLTILLGVIVTNSGRRGPVDQVPGRLAAAGHPAGRDR